MVGTHSLIKFCSLVLTDLCVVSIISWKTEEANLSQQAQSAVWCQNCFRACRHTALSASWLMRMVPQKGPDRKTHPLCLQDVRQLFRKLVQTLLQDRHLRLDLSHFKCFFFFWNLILLFINYPWPITWKYDTHLHHLVPGALMSQLPQAVDKALTALAVDPTGLQHGLALLHQLQDAWHATQ